jgi:hypothetical protein
MRPDDGTTGRHRVRFTIGRADHKLGLKIAAIASNRGIPKEDESMFGVAIAMVMAMMGRGDGAAQLEPEHARNPVYVGVLRDGLSAGGATFKLPEPRLRDGMPVDAQRAATRELAGSDQRLDELLRKSVTAPYLIKVHDVKAGDATIRVVDLSFVVYADIADVDPAKEAAKTDEKEVEAGNMVMRTRLLKPEELRTAGIAPPPSPEGMGPSTWYAHIHGRLVDRIEFDVTNQVVLTRTDESMVVASRTDRAFDKPGPFTNGWKSAGAGPKSTDIPEPYAGGISYTKISRLGFRPGAILVEMHGAFVEPHDWFQGAPILRSKFSVVAQDQIRSLRRELARRRRS